MPDPTDSQAAPVRVAVHHLGCKLNQYEAEAMQAGFATRGWQVVSFAEAADVYVVNTCTVTGSGDADSRRAVRRARRHNPQATVVATGCYAQRRPVELEDAGANLVVGNEDKAQLVDTVLDRWAGLSTPAPAVASPRAATERFLQIDGVVAGGRTRGTLQIQDGCSEHCTYCIIPAVRGSGVSRPAGDIVAQAGRMVCAGYRELALTGVHSGSYGYDQGDPEGLVELLAELCAIDGLQRLRLNSIEPGSVSDRLIDFAAASSRFCRHFHVPLQSGDDRTLRRMGRRYTAAYYAERIGAIARALPGCAIGADIMVGFPGESDDHFDSTRALVEQLPMTYLHVFPYSLRPDTPAQRLADHTTGPVKRERVRQLLQLGDSKRLGFHRSQVGATVSVLVEQIDGHGLASGLTDNYVRVRFESGPTPLRVNELVAVELTHARETETFGQRVAAA